MDSTLRAGGLDSWDWMKMDRLDQVWTGLMKIFEAAFPWGQRRATQVDGFSPPLVQTDHGWLVMPKNPAGEPWRVEASTQQDGQQNLVFTLGKPQTNTLNAASMLNGVPNRTGCYLLANPKKGLVSMPFSSVLLTVNNDPNHPILVRVQTSVNGLKSLPAGHSTTSQVARSIRRLPWSIVELFEIIQIPQVRNRLIPNDFQADLTKIQNRVQLPPGLTIAGFGTKTIQFDCGTAHTQRTGQNDSSSSSDSSTLPHAERG